MDKENLLDADFQALERFFDKSLSIYTKVLESNLMLHDEMYSLLKKHIEEHYDHKPFTILDLGCGNAKYMANTLISTGVKYYKGVDISKVYLEEAEENSKLLHCKKDFVQKDYCEELQNIDAKFDIIWSSYSLHHLANEEKVKFFHAASKVLEDDGNLIIVDIVRENDESREDYLSKCKKILDENCAHLTEEEKDFLVEHNGQSDYPETYEVYEKMAKDAGFNEIKVVLKESLYSFISFHK